MYLQRCSRSPAGQVGSKQAPLELIHVPRSGHLAGRKTEPPRVIDDVGGEKEREPQRGEGGRGVEGLADSTEDHLSIA